MVIAFMSPHLQLRPLAIVKVLHRHCIYSQTSDSLSAILNGIIATNLYHLALAESFDILGQNQMAKNSLVLCKTQLTVLNLEEW